MPTPILNSTLADSYLGEYFDGLLAELAHVGPGGPTVRPVLQLCDGDDAFVVTLLAPGARLADVEVHYADEVLTISGSHLHRAVYLPAAIRDAEIRTTLRGGVLTVEVPKAPGATLLH